MAVLTRVRRAIGALVLLCLGMITAVPVLAVTVGDACEKKCCSRKTTAHACCKRLNASNGVAMAATQARCCAGNANIGLARFDSFTGVIPVSARWAGLVNTGASFSAPAIPSDNVLAEHALFQRPPPVG